jgi:hypothetical protein
MTSEFKVFNKECFQKLQQHFQFLFEEELIQEM